VQISVRGIQRDDEGNEAVTESVSTGEFFEKNGTIYLLFEEETEDAGRVRTRLAYKDGRLELTKKGALSARMVFEQGRTHMTEYATPYGILKLGVATFDVSMDLSEDRLEICVCYALTDGEEVLSECETLVTATAYFNGFAPAFS
jgi:uncharacterized beta-barrel protein YwiB (DUF1934 family)